MEGLASHEATKEEVDDGLRVRHYHRAPDYHVKEVEHLSKEVPHTGTGSDGLAVYERVELAVVVHLVRMAEGTGGDLGDVLGVTQHPVEVKNQEGLVKGLTPTRRRVAI